MKRKLLLIAASMLVGMNAMAELTQVDGVYQIGTAQDLVDFSALVNAGNSGASAVLTADIDMSSVANFTPIGLNNDASYTITYRGTFNGQGHVISNLKVTQEDNCEVGFFSRTVDAVISNLGIVNSAFESTQGIRVGVFGGEMLRGSVTNCFSYNNTLTTTSTQKGGFGGEGANAGGIVALTNCYTDYSALFASGGTNNTNCYYGADVATKASSGELCYLLNGSQSTSPTWYQTLPGDAYPVLDSSHGTVYLAVDQYCDGRSKGETVYSNSASGTRDEHQLVDYICSVCGTVIENAEIKNGKWYEISTPGQLVWFSAWVNQGNIGVYGRLLADIDMSGVANFTPIGLHADSSDPTNAKAFRGRFNGQGHVIKNLTIIRDDDSEVGLFSRVVSEGDETRILNLGVENATIKSTQGIRCGVIAAIIVNGSAYFKNLYSAGTITIETSGETAGIANLAGATASNCYTTYSTLGSGSWSTSYAGNDVAAKAASGELCYLLNGSVSGGTTYYQEIDVDEYPVLAEAHGKVYACGTLKCDGTPDETFYSNTDEGLVQNDHNFGTDNSESVCQVCGTINPAYTVADVEGVYQIGTANDLRWFSAYVNQGNGGASAVLTADIDLAGVNFTPISLFSDNQQPKIWYEGTFDGQGHEISNLNVEIGDYESGLFSRINSNGKVLNVGVVNATVNTTANQRAGIIAGLSLGTITNCFSAGTIALSSVDAGQNGGIIGTNLGTISNAYTTFGVIQGGTQSTGEAIDSYANASSIASTGELAYKLGNTYYQTIGEDEYPVLKADHGVVDKMSDAGIGTFYATSAVTLNSAITVYAGVVDGSVLKLTQVDNTIPAGAAVIIEGEGYYSKTPAESATAIDENDLKGSDGTVTSDGTLYALALDSNDEPAFMKVASGTVIPAGKAYLTGISADVKAITFGTATSLTPALSEERGATVIYDLSGRRVEKATKGIYIINGKKVLK